MRNVVYTLHTLYLRRLYWCLATIICLLVSTNASVQASILPSALAAPEAQNSPGPFCRLGVNLDTSLVHSAPAKDITNYDLASLGVGWYVNYGVSLDPARPNGIQVTQMIRMDELKIQGTNTYTYTFAPDANKIKEVATQNPKSIWFLGNEPDRIIHQDDMRPDLYAAAYHELYHLLKGVDPSAQIYAGNIVQPTPVRLEYLDLVLNAYQARYGKLLPTDGWSIHNFILNEASCNHYNDSNICWGADIPPGIDKIDGLRIAVDDTDNFDLFTEQIVRFRQWMADRGYRGLPVLLSEYGVLLPEVFGYPPSRVNTFMTRTFDYVLNTKDQVLGNPNDDYRLIQRLSWYSVNDDKQYNGYLFNTGTFGFSAMGENYKSYAQNNIRAGVNFYVPNVTVTPTQDLTAILPGQAITHTVAVQIASDGNLLREIAAVVRVYDGDPNAGAAQIGTDQTINLAGCGDNTTVKVEWLTTVERAAQTPQVTVEWFPHKQYLPEVYARNQ